jgi:hypothetical protein
VNPCRLAGAPLPPRGLEILAYTAGEEGGIILPTGIDLERMPVLPVFSKHDPAHPCGRVEAVEVCENPPIVHAIIRLAPTPAGWEAWRRDSQWSIAIRGGQWVGKNHLRSVLTEISQTPDPADTRTRTLRRSLDAGSTYLQDEDAWRWIGIERPHWEQLAEGFKAEGRDLFPPLLEGLLDRIEARIEARVEARRNEGVSV